MYTEMTFIKNKEVHIFWGCSRFFTAFTLITMALLLDSFGRYGCKCKCCGENSKSRVPFPGRFFYPGGVSPRTLATLERQSDLLSVLGNSYADVIPPPTTFARLSTSFSLGLPLPLLPSNFPVTQTFSSC